MGWSLPHVRCGAVRQLAPTPAPVVVPGATVPGDVKARDHVRSGTVGAAIADGASHVILGRSVTRAETRARHWTQRCRP